MSKNDLKNARRLKHFNEKIYTWQRLNPPCVSTLDYWFIPSLLEQCVTDCQIFTAPNTDQRTKNVNRGKRCMEIQ